jgi:hypothetical protein
LLDDLEIGGRLGRFRVDRLLGEGGMGKVFAAHDTLLDVPVALKVLRSPAADREEIDRFKREVLLARRVTHPGVCRLFDIHEEGGRLFISMELVEGPTLHQLIQRTGGLGVERAVRLARQVCEAMAEAHAQGVIHRDLKPGNIIVRPGERVCILDFGLSKAMDLASITRAGMRIGTMATMAPEVLWGKVATPRSDIYSVGAMLYEATTGRLPFEGTDVIGLGRQVRRGEVVPPRELEEDISPALEAAILRALSMEPSARFPDFHAFAAALAAACPAAAQEPPEARTQVAALPAGAGAAGARPAAPEPSPTPAPTPAPTPTPAQATALPTVRDGRILSGRGRALDDERDRVPTRVAPPPLLAEVPIAPPEATALGTRPGGEPSRSRWRSPLGPGLWLAVALAAAVALLWLWWSGGRP